MNRKFNEVANLEPGERRRILTSMLKTDAEKARLARVERAAERYMAMRERREITATEASRYNEAYRQQESLRNPQPVNIPGDVRGTTGRSVRLTDGDIALMKQNAQAVVDGVNKAIKDRNGRARDEMICMRLEKSVEREAQREQAQLVSRRASAEKFRATFKERSTNSPREQFRDRGRGQPHRYKGRGERGGGEFEI